jgi:hypothetical protein
MLPMHVATLMLAATTLAVCGCGGASKTETTASTTTPAQSTTQAQTTAATTPKEIQVKTGSPLTRATWIAKGDAICMRINAKLAVTNNSTEQDLARNLPVAARYDRLEAAELSKLVPPAPMASDWSKVLKDLQKFATYTTTVAGYARANRFPEATPIVDAGNAVQKELTVIAARDGFKECSGT